MLIQLKHSEVADLRNKLLKEQNGICPICTKEITSPCLDHDHKKKIKGTGRVRKVVCSRCNILIAKMENNCVRYGVQQSELPLILRNMAVYLESPQTNYIHPSEAPKAKKLMKSSYVQLKKLIGDTQKVPDFPKSGVLTKSLQKLFDKYKLEPKFYKR